MARFIERVKEFASGKTAQEREMYAKAEAEIRRESMKAELEERKIQNIRLARERIRAKADARVKSFRQPQASSFGGGFNYGSMFGQTSMPRPTVRRVRIPTRRVKKSKARYRYVSTAPVQQQRFRVI